MFSVKGPREAQGARHLVEAEGDGCMVVQLHAPPSLISQQQRDLQWQRPCSSVTGFQQQQCIQGSGQGGSYHGVSPNLKPKLWNTAKVFNAYETYKEVDSYQSDCR